MKSCRFSQMIVALRILSAVGVCWVSRQSVFMVMIFPFLSHIRQELPYKSMSNKHNSRKRTFSYTLCQYSIFHIKVSGCCPSKMERLEMFLNTWVCTPYTYVGLICLETLILTENQRLFIVLSGNLHTYEHIFTPS